MYGCTKVLVSLINAHHVYDIVCMVSLSASLANSHASGTIVLKSKPAAGYCMAAH